MKTIRFTQNAPPYFAGDVASFPDDVADRYVKHKSALAQVPAAPPAAEDRPVRPAAATRPGAFNLKARG